MKSPGRTCRWPICSAAKRAHCTALVEADRATRRFDILEAWLLDRWSKAKMRPGLAAAAIPLLDRMNVAQTAAAVGLSPKRFIQAFRTEVGLTPKRFCRVRRFERLLQAIDTQANVHWPSLGLDHGYYDQAHLVHEFRSLSGYSPGEYLVAPRSVCQARATGRIASPRNFFTRRPARAARILSGERDSTFGFTRGTHHVQAVVNAVFDRHPVPALS